MTLQSRETQQEMPLAMSVFRARVGIVLLFVLLFSQQIRDDLVRAAYRPLYRFGWCISVWPAILIQAALLLIYIFFSDSQVFAGILKTSLCDNEEISLRPRISF